MKRSSAARWLLPGIAIAQLAGAYSSAPSATGLEGRWAAPSPQASGTCRARHVDSVDPQAWEPDPICTPGATDGGLALDQLCPVAHTGSIRPPLSFTEQLKRQQMVAYGFSDGLGAHEEDHLIALEAGGAPDDPRNLWPEPARSPNEKDGLEDFLHGQVCSGRIALAEAQHELARDWYGSWVRAGRPESRLTGA